MGALFAPYGVESLPAVVGICGSNGTNMSQTSETHAELASCVMSQTAYSALPTE